MLRVFPSTSLTWVLCNHVVTSSRGKKDASVKEYLPKALIPFLTKFTGHALLSLTDTE